MPTQEVVMPESRKMKRFVHFANRRKKRRRRHNTAAIALVRAGSIARKNGSDGKGSKVLELRAAIRKSRQLGPNILEVPRPADGKLRPPRLRGMTLAPAVPEDGQSGNGEAS